LGKNLGSKQGRFKDERCLVDRGPAAGGGQVTDHSQPRAGQSFNFNLRARDGVMAMTGSNDDRAMMDEPASGVAVACRRPRCKG